MDFHSIISTAQQNISSSSEKGKYYSTKFAPPKKVTKEKRLTAGILKFLEDKKREDEEKAEQARRKKQELVARRDPKEQRKIEKSLKVIKSSKKYFSGDKALDENNTLESEQPDEDDYGYTSTISDHFHKKLMEKYQKLPEDKKFANSGKHKAMSKEEIQSTKDRVKNALASKDDDHQPHFRQGRQERLSKIKSEKNKVFGPGNAALKAALPLDKKNGIKPKPKLKAAPIVDFQELLKLAEQKQHEEIIIDVPTKKEPERLLTSKEKREQEELEASRRAKMKPNRIPKLGAIPKIGDASKHDKNNNEGSMRRPSLPAPISNGASKSLPVTMQRQTFSNTEKLKRSAPPTALNSSSSKLRDALEPKQNGSLRPSPLNPKVPSSSKAGTSSSSVVKPREAPSKSINGQRPAVSAANSKMRPGTSSREPERTRDFPPKDLMRTREFPPRDLKRSREFPPKDMMRSREFPPRDPKRLKQPLTANKRRIEDEDSEYDSEMDDFIDDGDAQEDYSSEIKKIFGYDKSRYRDEDFDDSQMESDYRTVMREEFISKKLGLMEDLEDMKMEAEEKKLKDMRKKRKL